MEIKSQVQERHICGWCLESGLGKLIYVNGRMVLDSHPDCMTNGAVDQSAQCACEDSIHAGDNPNCPVHGAHGGENA